MSDDSFDRVWNQRLFVYDPSRQSERQLPCIFARKFKVWIDLLLEKHLDGANQVRLNQLKLVTQDKFFELLTRVPADHRHADDHDPDHPCVFSVYAQAIAMLHERELELMPPILVESRRSNTSTRSRTDTKPRSPLDVLMLGESDPEFGQ